MIAILDYGVGNLYSLSSTLKSLNIDTLITNREEDLVRADKIILPGVGAFEDAMKKLRDSGMVEPLLEQAAAWYRRQLSQRQRQWRRQKAHVKTPPTSFRRLLASCRPAISNAAWRPWQRGLTS